MKERFETEFFPERGEIALKWFHKIDPPNEKGHTVGVDMYLLRPDDAYKLAQDIIREFDRSQA